ncbi:hypothetical protein Hanom_Chr02g00161911 [Helianthus anomalus]
MMINLFLCLKVKSSFSCSYKVDEFGKLCLKKLVILFTFCFCSGEKDLLR